MSQYAACKRCRTDTERHTCWQPNRQEAELRGQGVCCEQATGKGRLKCRAEYIQYDTVQDEYCPIDDRRRDSRVHQIPLTSGLDTPYRRQWPKRPLRNSSLPKTLIKDSEVIPKATKHKLVAPQKLHQRCHQKPNSSTEPFPLPPFVQSQ